MAVGPDKDDADVAATRAAVAASSEENRPVGGRGPRYTPLFRAQNEGRYQRQGLIAEYEQEHSCRMVIVIDQITPDSVTFFAELLQDVSIDDDLHLMLCSPGGDGETAVRLIRMAQAACKRLVVVVPEIAKSAATIVALGAHEIIMGMTSDLGPIDPQVFVPERGFLGAKDLIEAVDRALADVAQRPDTYPMHAALLGGIDMTAVQFARSALARTEDLARQAISSNPDLTSTEIRNLTKKIKGSLVEKPRSHGAVIGADEASKAGLPVTKLSPADPQWQRIWTLWTLYFTIGPIEMLSIYEGVRASQVRRHGPVGPTAVRSGSA